MKSGSEELFNQLGLRQFGALPKFKLEPAPPLKRLVEIGVQREWDRRRDPALKAMGLEVAIEASSRSYCWLGHAKLIQGSGACRRSATR